MMNTTTFRVGCELNYEVSGPSAFIFNVGVVTNAFQRVLNEQFTTNPIYRALVVLAGESTRAPTPLTELHSVRVAYEKDVGSAPRLTEILEATGLFGKVI